MSTTNNVNNLNIFTFIKDIYQSLKHIDKSLTLSNDELNKRITKIEDNQQIIIDKIANIEIILNKLGEMNKPNSGLDKNIEFELLEKMKKLNQNEINNNKLFLKSEELTFANILENNYGFSDINQSIGFQEINNSFDNIEDILDTVNTVKTVNTITNESLNTLLF
jgi:hypothetical protein